MLRSHAPLGRPAAQPHTEILPKIDRWLNSLPTRKELYQEAVYYRDALGWNVFPVKCTRDGKKLPAIRWKPLQSRRCRRDQLRDWFDRPGVNGIAVVTGWISGWPGRKLFIRDFDDPTAYHAWATAHPELAQSCPTAITGRGVHVFCWSPYEVSEKLKDGELRGSTKGYTLLPPSLHPSGRLYRWVTHPRSTSRIPILDPREAGFFHVPKLKLKRTSSVTHEVDGGGSELGKELGELKESEGRVEGVGGSGVGENAVLSKSGWEAVWVSLPDGPGQRHRKLFDLARRLRGMPHLADAPADSLCGIVRTWWQKALPVIRTKDWERTWHDFRDAWEAVKHPIGHDPIHEMMRAASPESEPLEAGAYTRTPVRRLVTVCKALQTAAEIRGADRFFLSCRTAAIESGFTGKGGFVTASRWLKRLIADGVLELVKTGIGGTKSRLASQYRFLGLVRFRTSPSRGIPDEVFQRFFSVMH